MKSKLFLTLGMSFILIGVLHAQTSGFVTGQDSWHWYAEATAVGTVVDGPTDSQSRSNGNFNVYFTSDFSALCQITLIPRGTGWVRAHAQLYYSKIYEGGTYYQLDTGDEERDINDAEYVYTINQPLEYAFAGVWIGYWNVLAEARKEAAGSNPYAVAGVSVYW